MIYKLILQNKIFAIAGFVLVVGGVDNLNDFVDFVGVEKKF